VLKKAKRDAKEEVSDSNSLSDESNSWFGTKKNTQMQAKGVDRKLAL